MYDYYATVIRLVGPLSLHLDIDLGFNVHTRTTIRLDNIKQPEPAERAKVMAFVGEWLKQHGSFSVRSLYAREKYGRWLGLVMGEDGSVLNSELINSGLVEYIDTDEMPADDDDASAQVKGNA